MERMPHVLLVADGAERFAREIGMEAEDPLTAEATAAWREGLLNRFPGLDLSTLAARPTRADLVEGLNDPMAGWNLGHGTVDFLAQDRDGNLAAAVSTSGWSFGYPGRLGDAPVIGAAGYADNRWGAAASTGTGEVTLRTSACRSVILYLKMGWSLADALQGALKDLRDLRDPYVEHIALIGLDASGRHAGYSHRPNERYLYMTDAMSEPAEAEPHYVSLRCVIPELPNAGQSHAPATPLI
jgi:beta-aspartyl-peptidase (threonine type)